MATVSWEDINILLGVEGSGAKDDEDASGGIA